MSRLGFMLVVLAAIVVAGLVGAAHSARATFPGGDGRIAFTGNGSGNNDVYTVNPDGSGLVDVTNSPADDGRPDYSPDGTKIAFRSNRTGNQEIFTTNADGSDVKQITFNPAYDVQPVWSPDGTMIAFDSNRTDPNPTTCVQPSAGCGRDIFVMRADGSKVRQLTFDPGDDEWPEFSPDGSLVAYSTSVNGVYAIYTVNVRTLAVRKLTADNLQAQEPDWSPDGKKIVFENNGCNTCANSDVTVINADGTGLTQLTSGFGNNLDPKWSPGGDKIAFTHFNSGNDVHSQIYAMNADGSDITRVTSNSSDFNFGPDWGPR
jgi:Tol biopolymer transport system component